MARTIHFTVVLTQYAVLVLTGTGVVFLIEQVRRLKRNQEQMMANFEGLDSDISELKQAVADAAARVEAAVGRILDDTADQAEVDEARAEVRESIAALKAIAPITAEPLPVPPEPPVG